jgi:hypothetical protein
MKLPKHEALPPRVRTEELDVLMSFALRILLLGRIPASVTDLDELGAEYPFVLPFNFARTRLSL